MDGITFHATALAAGALNDKEEEEIIHISTPL